jgi:hypothetical protein
LQIPVLGTVTKDERFGWLYSDPVALRIFGNKPVRIVLEGYEEDQNKEDFHAAISKFLATGPEVLMAAQVDVFSFYSDINQYYEPADEDFVHIDAEREVWKHVRFGDEAVVGRRAYGDKGIYVSVECNCDWEPEHGMQIVFKNGETICKVGPYDGHLTNADAYADELLENVVYRSLG